MNHSFITIV